jgi:hypothetical protein
MLTVSLQNGYGDAGSSLSKGCMALDVVLNEEMEGTI